MGAWMKIKMFHYVSIITIFLMSLTVVELVYQLITIFAKQGIEEVSGVFQLDCSMAAIPVATAGFSIFKVAIEGVRSQGIFALTVLFASTIKFNRCFAIKFIILQIKSKTKFSSYKKGYHYSQAFSFRSYRNMSLHSPKHLLKIMRKEDRFVLPYHYTDFAIWVFSNRNHTSKWQFSYYFIKDIRIIHVVFYYVLLF